MLEEQLANIMADILAVAGGVVMIFLLYGPAGSYQTLNGYENNYGSHSQPLSRLTRRSFHKQSPCANSTVL